MASRAGEDFALRSLSSTQNESPTERPSPIPSPILPPPDQPHPSARPCVFTTLPHELLFILTLTFTISTSQLLGGLLMTTTNTIGHTLHMTTSEITWLTASESLTTGAFMLPFGHLADLLGRRPVILLSLATSTILFVAAGFITQPIVLDVFLGLIGLASAAGAPAAMGELGAVYKLPSKRRNRAFACCSAGSGMGGALGALFGGLVLRVADWRAGFWVLGVLCAIFGGVAWWVVPRDVEARSSVGRMENLKCFDLLGVMLAIAGVAMVTACLTLSGLATNGWRTPYILVLLTVGILALVCFILWEGHFDHPLMPLGIWKDRNFSLLVAILSLCFCGFSGNLLWLCLIWQRIELNTPLLVDAKLLPAAISGICTEIVVGMTMHRVGNRVFLMLGAFSFVISNTLLSASSEHITYWALNFPALILMTAGADFLFTVTNVYVLGHFPTEHQSSGSGVLITMSRFASTIGLGIQTSTFTSLGGASSGAASRLYRPYQSGFWVSLSTSAFALLLLPFVTVGRQGAELEGRVDDAEKSIQ